MKLRTWSDKSLAGRCKRGLRKAIYRINGSIQARRRVPNVYITCAGNTDGAGAQAFATVSTLLYAVLYNLHYVHTPFRQIEHAPPGKKEWEKEWEDFFGLGTGETAIEEVKGKIKRTVFLKHPLLLWKRRDTLYVVRNCHQCTDCRVNAYNRIRTALIAKLNLNRFQRQKTVTDERLRIAIHVRRGDVGAETNNERFTPLSNLTPLLEQVIMYCTNHNILYQIDLYSQGEIEDFNQWSIYPIIYHLNEDALDTFSGLVTSDILFIAKSAFSHLAAVLSDAFILYEDFCHPPQKDWVSMTDSYENRNKLLDEFFAKRLRRV